MRKAIMQELQAEYEQQRMQNEQQNLRNRAEAVAACPEIGEVLNARQEMIFAGIRGILNGQGAAEDIPVRMEVMNRRLGVLLEQHGFPADHLDPVFRCRRCEDTGYVGEPVREQCECLRTAFFTRLYKRVGLGENAEQSFDRFDLSIFSDEKLPGKSFSQREVMNVFRHQCQSWAEKYPAVTMKDVLMMGQSGLGKTYLMHAMAKVLLQRGFNVLMISAYRFLEAARKAYFSGNTEEMDTLIDADVLMIDDMGSEPLMENITIVQWFNLINERQLKGRGTVISTNLMEAELRTHYTERIASRLLNTSQCMILQFKGDDVRRRKA
ncbi:MAG: ATP-binding protein [Clostridia bacterium]|nr:ATP-binding protein [Clostridia bacterium]